jgi:hypothetical protein
MIRKAVFIDELRMVPPGGMRAFPDRLGGRPYVLCKRPGLYLINICGNSNFMQTSIE